MTFRLILPALLASAAPAVAYAQEEVPPAAPTADAPAEAEAPADETDEFDEFDEESEPEIVVTGQRERGAVIGDIEPELQLNRREIRSYGASNLSELLDAIAPQTQSGRGRGGERPVVLLNGRRISGFSEIRNIPPEAIERVDILPEEVALKYGYKADQRVVNFVLRRRFRAVTGELEGGFATAGGRANYEADANILRIDRGGRWNLDANYQHATPLLESERDIVQANPNPLFDLGDFRTLLAETDQVALNGTVNRTVLGDVSATLNTTFDANSSRSLLGVNAAGTEALSRRTDSLAGHVGLAFNGDIQPWRWSVTANYDRGNSQTRTETDGPTDRSETWTQSADAQLVVNGSPFGLPAGAVSTTGRVGFDTRGMESESFRGGIARSRDLSRDRGHAQASIDLPIASRRRDVLAAIGDLSVNFNAEVERLSDFGTLRTLGAGLNWSPIDEVSLIASVTDEDGAPSMQQLGDPLQVTPGARVFDFTRGETVDVTLITGGNPAITADNRRVFKLGATVRPFAKTDLSLTANYTNNRTRNPIASFPTATPEIEAAFPERFERDAGGRLVRIDTRPVNFARSDRQELRWGINFSKPIGPTPPPGGWRRGGQGGARPGEAGSVPAPATPGAPAGEAPRGERGGAGGRGQGGWRGGGGGGAGGGFRGGGGRGFGGGGRGGVVQLSLYHTWRLQDRVLIREGVPELDFLNGSAAGNRGGRPRHEVDFQAGVTKNGLGARLSANWLGGTTVRGGPDGRGGTTGDLSFSDMATINLRLFADLGAQRSLVRDHPWLRGTRISLAVDNLFDAHPQVRDQNGLTPLGYQPGYLDPLGRSVRISVRKLFF